MYAYTLAEVAVGFHQMFSIFMIVAGNVYVIFNHQTYKGKKYSQYQLIFLTADQQPRDP